MKDECNVCRGKMVHKTVTYTQLYEGRYIVIENVPAWVCENCGEIYYDPDVGQKLLNLIWSGKAPQRTIEAAVYEFELATVTDEPVPDETVTA